MIYKLECPALNSEVTIVIPLTAKLLSVGKDPSGKACFWYSFDKGALERHKTVKVANVGTGVHGLDEVHGYEFLGTFVQGQFVNHLFYKEVRRTADGTV